MLPYAVPLHCNRAQLPPSSSATQLAPRRFHGVSNPILTHFSFIPPTLIASCTPLTYWRYYRRSFARLNLAPSCFCLSHTSPYHPTHLPLATPPIVIVTTYLATTRFPTKDCSCLLLCPSNHCLRTTPPSSTFFQGFSGFIPQLPWTHVQDKSALTQSLPFTDTLATKSCKSPMPDPNTIATHMQLTQPPSDSIDNPHT